MSTADLLDPPDTRQVAALKWLRPYQYQAVMQTLEEWKAHNATLVVMPTGSGKTVVFAAVARMAAEQFPGGRILVVAHRDELIRQAADKITRFTGLSCDIEMGESYADQCTLMDRAPVLVTSVQTMSRPRRMERFHPDDFSVVIIDEAHHAVASTYLAVIAWFRQNTRCKILGVTATPDRSDEAALGRVFQSVAFDYTIIQAIDDGWLVGIEQQFIEIEGLDLSTVKTTAGDLNQGQLATILEQEKILHGYADPTIRIAGDDKTLMFTASVDQAEQLCNIFNRHRRESARWICGDEVRCPLEKRHADLKDFAAGRFQFLVNCAVLLEGYDEPGIKIVGIARPTKSRSLYAQMVGRGTRPIDGLVDRIPVEDRDYRLEAIACSSKPSLLVLDFVGNAGKHKLVHTGDLLGGEYDDEVTAEATRAVTVKSTRGERADMLAELRTAELNKKKRLADAARVRVSTKFTSTKIDPFGVWDILPKREPGWFAGKEPTGPMRAALERQKAWKEGMSFWDAKQILDEMTARREKGLCSYAQSKLLKKHQFNPDMAFDEAHKTIDKIVKSKFRLKGNWQE